MNTLSEPTAPSLPWWKYPHMWMVIGGPLVVVIASFVTLWLALSIPDPVYSEDAEPGESSSAPQPPAKAPPPAAMLSTAPAASAQASGNAPR